MKTININGKDYTVEELTTILDNAKKENPMLEVFKYHNLTEQQFEEMYKNVPSHVKAYAKEVLVVEFYNKGWKPDWNNSNERKWYPWFYLDGEFRLIGVDYFGSNSFCSTRLCFKNESDAKDAGKKFLNVFKESRQC